MAGERSEDDAGPAGPAGPGKAPTTSDGRADAATSAVMRQLEAARAAVAYAFKPVVPPPPPEVAEVANNIMSGIALGAAYSALSQLAELRSNGTPLSALASPVAGWAFQRNMFTWAARLGALSGLYHGGAAVSRAARGGPDDGVNTAVGGAAAGGVLGAATGAGAGLLRRVRWGFAGVAIGVLAGWPLGTALAAAEAALPPEARRSAASGAAAATVRPRRTGDALGVTLTRLDESLAGFEELRAAGSRGTGGSLVAGATPRTGVWGWWGWGSNSRPPPDAPR